MTQVRHTHARARAPRDKAFSTFSEAESAASGERTGLAMLSDKIGLVAVAGAVTAAAFICDAGDDTAACGVDVLGVLR